MSVRVVQPTVIKQGSMFLLCTDTGDIQSDCDQGLYFRDMRYINCETLRLEDAEPVSLLDDASEGYRAVFELTNPDLEDDSGALKVRKEMLGIRREKCLGDDYIETLTLENYSRTTTRLTLHLAYAADFADMFVVRGMHPGKRGELHPPRWHGKTLTFAYDGADGHKRRTTLHFSHTPDTRQDATLAYDLTLKARQKWQLTITCELRDQNSDEDGDSRPRTSQGAAHEERSRAKAGKLGQSAQFETSNTLFNEVLGRSFMDLHMLRMRQHGDTFFAAGVPWYVALFGRDSLITAMQTLPAEPDIAANTLRCLAGHQGRRIDDFRDEQPGKILHELRVDELANLNEIPQTPYYGSVDSTPLFLALLGLYSRWSGVLDLFEELRDNVRAALDWIDDYGDSDGDGFIDYQSHSTRGGRNQGWKDSGNGIVMEDGDLAEPPIAMPEVQGDVYLAWQCMAELFERAGERTRAGRLRRKAQDLFVRFNREFWLADERYFALCRQKDGRFSKSIASNGAHALWTGIVDPAHARDVVRRVLQPDMFSGWGIRTLSSKDRSYNPVDYQVGSVWPHDNALIVNGMHRYGFPDEANRVFTAVMRAATRFDHFRLPEVFAGYDEEVSSKPVKYPVACNPQAWAAGSIPLMLISALGLQPNGFERRLEITRPCLPDWLQWVAVRNLRVAGAQVDLRYERTSGGTTSVEVTSKEGDIDVNVSY